jgi:hypothetical protein
LPYLPLLILIDPLCSGRYKIDDIEAAVPAQTPCGYLDFTLTAEADFVDDLDRYKIDNITSAPTNFQIVYPSKTFNPGKS